jgi:hypothetical protein
MLAAMENPMKPCRQKRSGQLHTVNSQHDVRCFVVFLWAVIYLRLRILCNNGSVSYYVTIAQNLSM